MLGYWFDYKFLKTWLNYPIAFEFVSLLIFHKNQLVTLSATIVDWSRPISDS